MFCPVFDIHHMLYNERFSWGQSFICIGLPRRSERTSARVCYIYKLCIGTSFVSKFVNVFLHCKHVKVTKCSWIVACLDCSPASVFQSITSGWHHQFVWMPFKTVVSEVFKRQLLGIAISTSSCLIRGTVFKMSFKLSKTLLIHVQPN